MTIKELENDYNKLFSTNEEKAAAFDKIAKEYYFCNFAEMSKTDFETLLFSIYLDQILKQSEEDMNTYSDYILSKKLGITQSKVSNLKVKKELKYPYEGFDWKESFYRLLNSKNARYENGKIKIFIPDKNLYLEIKNAIENNGGYIEQQLTSNLLQITPEYFVELLVAIKGEDEKKKILKDIETIYNKNNKEKYIKEQRICENLKGASIELIKIIIATITETSIQHFLNPSN